MVWCHHFVSYRICHPIHVHIHNSTNNQKQCSSPIVNTATKDAVAIKNKDDAKLNSDCNSSWTMRFRRTTSKQYMQRKKTHNNRRKRSPKNRPSHKITNEIALWIRKFWDFFFVSHLGSTGFKLVRFNEFIINWSQCHVYFFFFFHETPSGPRIERKIFFRMFIIIAIIVCVYCGRPLNHLQKSMKMNNNKKKNKLKKKMCMNDTTNRPNNHCT